MGYSVLMEDLRSFFEIRLLKNDKNGNKRNNGEETQESYWEKEGERNTKKEKQAQLIHALIHLGSRSMPGVPSHHFGNPGLE